jgi:hypothetical protein
VKKGRKTSDECYSLATVHQIPVTEIRRAPGKPVSFAETRLGRRLVPSLADILFIALLAWLLAGSGPSGLLTDGDVGWHIRTGDYILENRAVPQQDLFTFTKPGAPWFAWEWLADVALSLVHSSMGLKGVVLLAAVVLAAWPVVVLRHALWRGANVWMAVVFTLLAVGGASIHYLARPHVFTLLFTALAAWLIDADLRHRSRRVFWLVPLTLLWTNVHGGFGLAIALALLTSAGVALEAWAGQRAWRDSGRYALLAGMCALASAVNPYGVRLHAHVFAYLRSDWIRQVVDEFRAPDFRSEGLMQFELVLFTGLVLTAVLLARKQFVAALWVVVFAHLSLTSARHVPVYLVVAAPVIASLASEFWLRAVSHAGRNSIFEIIDRIGSDARSGFMRFTFWPAVALLGFIAAGDVVRWPADFPEERFPVKLIRQHADLIAGSRVLTVDQWGDYLIYAHYPRQRVFADGRSDFLGPELGNEYIAAMQGSYTWEGTLDRYAVDAVLTPATCALSTILKISPAWRVVADDGRAVLLTRTDKVRRVP